MEETQFVVGTRYADAIVARAGTLGIPCGKQESQTLPLTLLAPEWGDRRAIADLDTAVAARRDTTVLRIVSPPVDGASHLDKLMFCLRYDYARDCGGWMPPMGKNRTLFNVNGVPHVDPGEKDYPEPADPPPLQEPYGDGHEARIRVAVLDTPLYPHPFLAGTYLARGADLLAGHHGEPLHHSAGHATFIAGLIAMRAPHAELDVRKTLSGDHATSSVWELVHHMMELRGSGARILNLSLGCYTEDGRPPMLLEYAVRELAPDVVIVAAAGNHGIAAENARHRPGVTPQSPFWPAAMEEVVSVGAYVTDARGTVRRAEYSPDLPWVNFTAPGEYVSTYLDGEVTIPDRSKPELFEKWATWNGTSFAAAAVTGHLAALARPCEPAFAAVDRLRQRAEQDPGEVRLFTVTER
jgi:subtilisin family serine protease